MAGTLVVDIIQSGASGTPPTITDSAGTQIGTLCRAWVNFDGNTGTTRSSFNVTSVTKSSTSNYTISFTAAMPDTYYVIVVGAGNATGATTLQSIITACNPINTSSCFVSTSSGANAANPYSNVQIAVFH